MTSESLIRTVPSRFDRRRPRMNKKGFTLIELLIVVVIIGILAAIAIPRFGATRDRAFVSAMQSDLNQVRTVRALWELASCED